MKEAQRPLLVNRTSRVQGVPMRGEALVFQHRRRDHRSRWGKSKKARLESLKPSYSQCTDSDLRRPYRRFS